MRRYDKAMTDITWTDLAIYVADEDFIEYLHELGYDTIEEVELYEEWDNWSKENVDHEYAPAEPCCSCYCNSCLLNNCCQRNVFKIPANSYGTYTTIEYK